MAFRRAPRRSLTPAQQLLGLRNNPISAGSGASGSGGLTWRFRVSPDPLGRLYDLRLDQPPGSTPRVFVEAPDLTSLAGGRKLPHVYSQRPTRLCLFLPGAGQWEPWLLLDRTVVPWSVLWLWYFEEWLHSDDWKGGGVHPASRTNSRVDDGDRA